MYRFDDEFARKMTRCEVVARTLRTRTLDVMMTQPQAISGSGERARDVGLARFERTSPPTKKTGSRKACRREHTHRRSIAV
jgi:hypothetical protein